MSLPSRWTDALFSKLTLIYGHNFLRQWDGIPIETVKAEWAEELTGFQQSPNAIKHGLDNVNPDKPPNVLQFKALCLKAPQYHPKALPAPKADDAVVKAVVSAIKKPQGRDPKHWAHSLKAREEAGDKLTQAQRDMWRAALAEPTPEAA